MTYELRRRRTDTIADSTLFAEMERIWGKLGHRPSRHEWETANPNVSYITYRRRFGGWVRACTAFIDSRMSPTTAPPINSTPKPVTVDDQRDKRDVPLKVRLRVLDRDDYRCVLCGRSPAILRGVVLHLDHVRPYSQGGKTTFDNLRTLCAECNLGKGGSDGSAA